MDKQKLVEACEKYGVPYGKDMDMAVGVGSPILHVVINGHPFSAPLAVCSGLGDVSASLEYSATFMEIITRQPEICIYYDGKNATKIDPVDSLYIGLSSLVKNLESCIEHLNGTLSTIMKENIEDV